MKLKLYNKSTNKSMICETQANIDITNTLIASALLKSINNVHKTDFDSISYI